MEGSGGGGEVRRIHVVYLLSRMGRMEQPHLFRVHHLARSGVRLKGGRSSMIIPIFFFLSCRLCFVFVTTVVTACSLSVDVKRWLGELRGKNMADSFSWSYKRSCFFFFFFLSLLLVIDFTDEKD